MKLPKSYKNARPLIWFTAALTLFLAVGVALSISWQRKLLIEQLNSHIDREAGVLEAVITEDLLTYNYTGMRHYLAAFAVHSNDISSIRAIAPNGMVLAEYSRPDPAIKPFKRRYGIKQGKPPEVTIELTHDLEPLHQALTILIAKNIAASILFASAMALFLWLILKKTAFIPLQNALRELNTVNAGLEQRVAERTADWMRANTDLKNEISEREAAQRELVIRDRAIASSVNGISFMALDGTVTYVNNSCLSMWGYRDPDEVVGRSSVEFWQSREIAEGILQTLHKAGSWSGELVAARKDGTCFDVQVSADVVRGGSGQPLCIMAAILDITERKRAEAELRKERDFTAAVLETVGSIVLVLDRKGRIIRFNRACEQVSGYTFLEAQGKLFWEFLVTEEQVEPVKAVFDMLSAGKFPSSHENYWETKSGAKRMISWSNTCLTDEAGRVSYIIATGIDITESRRAAEELARSEATHRMVVENISEIIYSMTLSEGRLQGTIDFLSGSVERTVGYGISDFSREPGLWLSLIHPDDLPAMKEETRRMVRDRTVATRLYRVRHRDTLEHIWLEDRIVPRFDREGKVIGYFGVVRDVARRKQAEDGLKDALVRAEEEKNKSAAIIAAIADGISIQDRDFRVLYQNRHHRELIGDHVGEYCYQAYHRRDNVCPNCPVALTFGDEKVHTVEQTGMTPTGPVHVEITTSPLRDSTGAVVAGIEVVRNITDRKKSEEDVRRAYETQYLINALLRIPLDGRSIEAVLLKALDIILSSSWYVSLSKGAIFLSEEDGSLTMKVQRGLDPAVQAACATVEPGKCLCGRALRTGAIQFSSHIDEHHELSFAGISPHGHYCVPMGTAEKPLGVLSLCLEDGHPHDVYEQEFLTAVANALTGIIHRKRMEEEREQMIRDLQSALNTVSASRLEWLVTFDSITDMISIHDEDFRIIKANKAFARRFGLAPQDVIHKKCYELFHDRHLPAAECPHQKTLERNGPVTEEVTDPKTGRLFLISTFPFHSSESGKRGIVHIARDITEARENETRLVMSERLAALGKMASGIAHEINNPLAAIAGCVDGMNRRISRGDFDQELFKKYLAIMKEELIRSKNITTSMLSIVQTRDYERRPVRVHDTILKSLDIIGYQGRLKNVTVVKKFAGGSLVLQASEGELKQVFLIILTNALDAMEDRGTLSVETAVQDGVLCIAISDTGPGIAPENMTRMFDPFFTTKSERGGTGLGLSIAGRIVAGHKGRIRVSSNPGTGATITIELPF